MRVSSRAIVTSVAAFALAVGWIGASGASARPASEPPAARHIVVFHDDVDPDAVARDHGRRHGAQVERVYHNALKGYVATFKGTGAADVARDPRVDFVELDQKVSVHGDQAMVDGEPWGLDRIDERDHPLDKNYHYANTGAGVTAYIIDTGIRSSHQEFGSRVLAAPHRFDAFGGTGEDCDGHGTHVAGTVGGATYGVAKAVDLVPVRVLNCTGSGSWSGVIAGIDWVTGHHINRSKTTLSKSVANMSLGGPTSSAVDAAVNKSINAGVTYAVAAGNGNVAGVAQDACKSSPARVPNALTIGATDSTDRKASWSNFGKCVDLFAPGVNVLSAFSAGNTASATMSGTSMASPHTAGVVALYLQTADTLLEVGPSAVRTALVGALTTNVVSAAGKGSFNGLLYSGVSAP